MKEQLIMIPGTLCDRILFKHQLEGLKGLADCQIGNHSSSDDLVKVASNIINKIKGDFSIMGLSYGGIIAFEIWRQVPERIKRIILLNTNHRPPSNETRAIQQRFLSMSLWGEFKEITTKFLKDALLHPKHAKDIEMRKVVLKMALNTGKEKFYKQIKAQLQRPDSTLDLPNILCPVLVITGKQDSVCTPEIHQEIAALIPNSSLELIDDCGHLSTIEQPEVVNQLVKNWWSNN